MMKRLIIVAAAILALAGCAQKRFDRVQNTPVSRYDIVYDDDRCGIFDNEADSLVTPIEYESLSFLKRAVEDSVTVVLFSCSKDGLEGMMGVLEQNNEKMEILFPKE
jgi:hypothetical protein